MDDKQYYKNYLPLFGAICIVLGLFLGRFLYQDEGGSVFNLTSQSSGKVDEVIENVVENYVDPVNEKEITEFAIKKLLAHLDPHSTYIPPKEVEVEKERMSGKFEGIGIEFRIIQDTLMVVNPIEGGPSQIAGISSGDRIIGLDGKEIALGKLSTDSLVSLLRGPSGSEVQLMVSRPFQKVTKNISVTRGEIPIYSVDASMMIKAKVGYVKISRFSYQTAIEFKNAVHKLLDQGAKQLVIDVRDNPGGSLGSVVEVCNELLPSGRNIVYTKGNNEQETYNSSKDGDFMDMDIAVVINRNSASASEILAGALQDNDRAIIVGRRTFGKGLVQAVLPLKDDSRIHLTIARYYTPSGRCIQKAFEKDNLEAYNEEGYERFNNGELYFEDSIEKIDSLKFKTLSGRAVYGGGGVMPDVFVPYDSTWNSKMLFAILKKNLLSNYATQFWSTNKIKGSNLEESLIWVKGLDLSNAFKIYCTSNGIEWNAQDWKASERFVNNELKARILKVKYKDNGYFRYLAETDDEILTAINALNKGFNLNNQP